MLFYYLLVCIAIVGLAESARNGNGNGASFSPVRELGPSLAASVAGGTIIAARSPLRPSLPKNIDASMTNYHDEESGDDDCLVVLFRSPIVSESGKQRNYASGNLTVSSVFATQTDDEKCNDTNNQHQKDNYYHGLTFLSNGPVNFPFLPSSSSNNLRILHAPSGLLVAATGFAPDAEHILNVAAGRVFSRISVSAGGKSVDPHRLVREDLSSMMIDAAMSDGGRPLGVQLLVVGQSALSRRKENDCPLEIYTIDPSGGWRNCVGKGTAVGRGAERVHSSLFQSTKTKPDMDTSIGNNDVCSGWRGALDRAMMAAVDALEQDDNPDNDSETKNDQSAQYGALVIFSGSNALKARISTSRCASVSSGIVRECYTRCCDRSRHKKLAE